MLGKGTLHNDFTSFTQTGNTFTLTGTAIWSTRAEGDAATAKGDKENGDKLFTMHTTTGTVTSTGFVATTVNTVTGTTARAGSASG